MIVLFTDFGNGGFYLGQMRAVIAHRAPGVPVVDLMHDAPAYAPGCASYLLAALAPGIVRGAVVLAVVDPGVGGPRRPIVVRADDRLFVGPDNGLFEVVMRRATTVDCQSIEWRPAELSATFHGRDLFAPVAAALAKGTVEGCTLREAEPARCGSWPDDLPAVIYVDGYGNLITGLRASTLAPDVQIGLGGAALTRARTFGDVPPGTLMWYENSIGLVEIAVNKGNAARLLTASIGTEVRLER
jgi:S-adenosylmethionine hydrolase